MKTNKESDKIMSKIITPLYEYKDTFLTVHLFCCSKKMVICQNKNTKTIPKPLLFRNLPLFYHHKIAKFARESGNTAVTS